MSKKIKCALIGPGNIGTDLLAKLQRSPVLEPVWMVGIDPESDGLKRAREMGIKTTDQGVDGLITDFPDRIRAVLGGLGLSLPQPHPGAPPGQTLMTDVGAI